MSSLFSNVISVLGLPVILVLAVIFFHEKMNWVKAISILLAIWGFISYFYQHYLDDSESKAKKRDVKDEISMISLLKEVTAEQDELKNIYQKVPLSTETNFQNCEHWSYSSVLIPRMVYKLIFPNTMPLFLHMKCKSWSCSFHFQQYFQIPVTIIGQPFFLS